MKDDYRFTHRKGRPIQVMFAVDKGRWHTTGTDNMKEAVLWAERWLDEFAGGKTRDGIKFATFARDFYTKTGPKSYRQYAERRGEVRDEDYYSRRQAVVDNYLIPKFGNQRLDSIDDIDIEDYVLSAKSVRDGYELSTDMRNRILFVMRQIMHEAKRQHYISRNPAIDVSAVPTKHRHRENFSKDELARMFPDSDEELLRLWGSLTWAVYYLVMRDTGFRPGEVAGLTVSCWEADSHGFQTSQEVDMRTRKFKKRIKTTDSGYTVKVGLVSPRTERLLGKLMKGKNPDDMIFLTSYGTMMEGTIANKKLRSVQKKLGFENLRSQYSLRHSFETEMLKKLDDKSVAILMGHMRYRKEYDHRTGKDLLKQVQDERDTMFS